MSLLRFLPGMMTLVFFCFEGILENVWYMFGHPLLPLKQHYKQYNAVKNKSSEKTHHAKNLAGTW